MLAKFVAAVVTDDFHLLFRELTILFGFVLAILVNQVSR
jgi:hypothetical protein